MQIIRRTLSQKLKAQRYLVVLGALLFSMSITISFASDADTKELKEQQQKLQQILDEIGVVQEQRAEQKALLEKLSRKMQCNWDLIQDYDACDKKYKEQKQEQLSCAQKAKERASGCLSDIDK